MKKTMVLGLVFLWLLSPLVDAAGTSVEAGNAVCPVSGDKVSGKDFVDYKDKKYGLCCAMCAGKFNKNPEKYLEEMSAEEGSKEGSQEHHEHPM